MKNLLLLCFVGAALYADTTTVTYTLAASNTALSCGDIGGTCGSLDFSVPQFNSTGGTLTAVNWTFSDFMQYYGGINDMYDPLVGDPYTYTTTEGDTSAVLGLDASTSQFNSGVIEDDFGQQISMGGQWQNTTIQASGSALDLSAFTGDGNVLIDVVPFLEASFPTSSNGAVEAGFSGLRDYATLTITYVDPPCATPEPAMLPLVAGLLGLGLAIMTRSRTARI